ncbi:MAG: HAD family hydrolase, partial [Candidatus Cryptobacteroides sp.]
RSIQQRNKIEALGLNRWIENDDIIISEEFGSEKPALANYEYYMKRYPECCDFTYIGDNPNKDFVVPNILGWETICLIDDGRNIHKQGISAIGAEAMPNRVVMNLTEIL